MNVKSCWANFRFYTSKTSDIARQLAFAGIALIWIFKTEAPDKTVLLHPFLHNAGFFIVLGLVLDIAQYLAGSIIWHLFSRHKELEESDSSAEFRAPSCINIPMNALFYIKIVPIAIAYWYILRFLYYTLMTK